jgi:hypothetical protein
MRYTTYRLVSLRSPLYHLQHYSCSSRIHGGGVPFCIHVKFKQRHRNAPVIPSIDSKLIEIGDVLAQEWADPAALLRLLRCMS